MTNPIVDYPYNNAFEYGENRVVSSMRQDSYVSYTDAAVMRYRTGSIDAILADSGILVKMIRHHLARQVPRLFVLEQYYLANNPVILSGNRRTEKEKSDHRVRHGFASIISDFLNSYVLTNPVKITDASPDESKSVTPFIQEIDDFNRANDIDSHNLEIGKDQNNMGRAFELLQRTEDDEDKIYRLDPREVFMIYDKTVRTRVIGACRYYQVDDYDDSSASEAKYAVELYTPEKIVRYKAATIANVSTLEFADEPEELHSFGGVPIIEYRSDRFRMGVYEKQLSQIDAYDAAQSDTANYMTDFNDAILVLEGKIESTEDLADVKAMKDANVMVLVPSTDAEGRPGPVKASYLTKQYDVAGVEAYKTRIKDDIFNFASIPNLSDEKFAGNQSGEALKYKMFGLQQKRNDKEKFLAKGFRVRYKLLENLKRSVKEFSGEPVQLTFDFTPNLPTAYLEELKTFIDAGGELSQETKLELLSFVEDASKEQERIAAERSGFDQVQDPYGEWPDAAEAKKNDESKALNGAQITSVLAILSQMQSGLIDETQALSLLINGLGLSADAAERIVGRTGGSDGGAREAATTGVRAAQRVAETPADKPS